MVQLQHCAYTKEHIIGSACSNPVADNGARVSAALLHIVRVCVKAFPLSTYNQGRLL